MQTAVEISGDVEQPKGLERGLFQLREQLIPDPDVHAKTGPNDCASMAAVEGRGQSMTLVYSKVLKELESKFAGLGNPVPAS